MNPINGFTSICLVFLVMYSIGLLIFLSDFEEENCEMTYMFEYPQFVEISNKKDEQFKKYGLFAYSEGRFTTRVRNMHFDGIPVLFIPGNAGSYKQVRSLSSVALRKALSLRSSYHFDYFTVNLNSELSGIYGPLLYDQKEYVKSCLERIFELYREGNKPPSIVIIGHSIGGLIARTLISEMETIPVSVLISLAAPLKRPPLIFDYQLNSFYNDYNKSTENNKTLFVSISGGHSDFLIPSYLSDTNGNNSIHAVTTNVPRSWVETNHVQIVWCKQLILAISRALFDSVDLSTKQISNNVTYLHGVFKHHLVQHSGIKIRKSKRYSDVTEIDHRGQWIENLLRQYSVEFLHGSKETHWYMVKLNSLPGHQMLTVLGINVETVDWLFACNAYFPKGASRVCTKGIHLTHLSEMVPSIKYKRRLLQINLHDLKNNTELTHVVIRSLPTNEPVVFHVDIYNSVERRIVVDLPSWWSFKKTVILEETSKNAVHYELALPQLQHILQFYQLFVEPLKCVALNHHASATLTVAWGNQNHHAYFTDKERSPFNVRLYTSRPLSSNGSATVRLTLDPSCTYKLSIKSSIFGSVGQIARVYTPLLLTNITVIVLLILRYQLKSLRNGNCPIFFVAIKEGARPYYVLPFVKLLSLLVSKTILCDFLPESDSVYLAEDGTEFFILPMLLFLSSIGIVLLLCVIYSISLVTLDSTIHKLSMKLTGIAFFSASSDYITTLLEKAPFIAAGILVFTSFTTCGSLALCLGAVLYFLKLTHMSQDYVEKIVWHIIKPFVEKLKKIFRRKIVRTIKEDAQDVNKVKNKEDDITTNSTEKMTDGKTQIEDERELQKNNEKQDILNKNIQNISNMDESVEERNESVEQNETEASNAESSENANDELSTLNNSLFFHSTIFFIWCIITIINVPAALTWAHNFKFSKTLTPDSSFIPGFILSLCALPLWQFDLPRTRRKWASHMQIFVTLIAILSVTYATISIYRLNYLLTLVIVVLIFYQLFAPQEAADGAAPTSNDDKEKDKFNYDKHTLFVGVVGKPFSIRELRGPLRMSALYRAVQVDIDSRVIGESVIDKANLMDESISSFFEKITMAQQYPPLPYE